MSLGPFPVVIAGGGPAGAAAALTLRRRGVSCLVVEAAAAIRAKVGEALPPGAGPLLAALGVPQILTAPPHALCRGNRFLWGTEEIQETLFFFDPHGPGHHLDRQAFEKRLAAEAERAGAAWWRGSRLTNARREDGAWRLTLVPGGEVAASFLIDAAGRSSPLGRALGGGRRRGDRLVGLACPFLLGAGAPPPPFTHIEAMESGWWYAAPLPSAREQARLMAVFLTDGDLLDRTLLTPPVFEQALALTRLLATLLPPGSRPEGQIIPRATGTARLQRITGEGWLATGDAAFAYDPVSSHGLTAALGSGFYAGQATADHLAGSTEALAAYEAVLEHGFARYLEGLHRQYGQERRWPESPFWQRRHQPTAKGSPLPPRERGQG